MKAKQGKAGPAPKRSTAPKKAIAPKPAAGAPAPAATWSKEKVEKWALRKQKKLLKLQQKKAEKLEKRKAMKAAGMPIKKRKKKPQTETGPTKVVLSKIPLQLNLESVKAMLRGASSFRRCQTRTGRLLPTAFVTFQSGKLAKKALALKTVDFKGHTVQIEPFLSEKDRADLRKRTAFFKCYIPDLTEQDVRSAFPNAAAVTVAPCAQEGKVKCFVVFPTVEEYNAALKKKTATVRNQPVYLLESTSFDVIAAKWELNRNHCILLRAVPEDVTEEDLRTRFPAAQRLSIRLPTPGHPQRSASVVFSTKQQASDVAKAGSVEVKGHSLRVELSEEANQLRGRSLFLTGCPPTTTAAALQSQYPAASEVRLLPSPEEFGGDAVVTFGKLSAAREAARHGHFQLAGTAIHVSRGGTEKKEALRCNVLRGCPATTTEDHVRQRFPTAVFVKRQGAGASDTSSFLVEFGTRKEAAVAAQTRHVQINGGFAELRPKGVDPLKRVRGKRHALEQRRAKKFSKRLAEKFKSKRVARFEARASAGKVVPTQSN